MPEASSSKVAPRLKISALVLIFYYIPTLFLRSSGAIYTESPSTSSSFKFLRLSNWIA